MMATMRRIAALGSPAPRFSQKLCTPRRRALFTAYSWKITCGARGSASRTPRGFAVGN